jgi:hypothetical protein
MAPQTDLRQRPVRDLRDIEHGQEGCFASPFEPFGDEPAMIVGGGRIDRAQRFTARRHGDLQGLSGSALVQWRLTRAASPTYMSIAH